MTTGPWDVVLDELERALDEVDTALDEGRAMDDLPSFDPPDTVLPPLVDGQRARAQSLLRRQAVVTARVVARIEAIHDDLGDLRRRRRAALAYVRGG